MILVQANGAQSTAADLWSTNHNAPAPDNIKNIDAEFISNSTHVTFKVTRDLKTGASDYSINLVCFNKF